MGLDVSSWHYFLPGDWCRELQDVRVGKDRCQAKTCQSIRESVLKQFFAFKGRPVHRQDCTSYNVLLPCRSDGAVVIRSVNTQQWSEHVQKHHVSHQIVPLVYHCRTEALAEVLSLHDKLGQYHPDIVLTEWCWNNQLCFSVFKDNKALTLSRVALNSWTCSGKNIQMVNGQRGFTKLNCMNIANGCKHWLAGLASFWSGEAIAS